MSFFVSVIIPTYNGEAFLAQAIESVLAQNYRPLEIIVVDDGSTDRTPQIAAAAGVNYVSQPHSGCPATGRNRGIRLAQGEIIAFIDQDDLWPANKLALQIPYLADDPQLQIVAGQTQPVWLSGQAWEPVGRATFLFHLGSALFRKTAFETVGFFDKTLQYFSDDGDWFMRARESGVSMIVLQEITLLWRMHAQNTSRSKTVRHRSVTEILKKSLDRRRKQGQGGALPVPQFSQFNVDPEAKE